MCVFILLCANFSKMRLPEPGPIPRVLELVLFRSMRCADTSDAQADQDPYQQRSHYKRTYFLCANFLRMRYNSRCGF